MKAVCQNETSEYDQEISQSHTADQRTSNLTEECAIINILFL